MKRALVVGVVMLLLTIASAAVAHPLGNFTVNRYSGIEVSPTEITVHYAIDMAEVPTFQEMGSIDLDEDGDPDAEELDRYAQEKALLVRDGIRLTANGDEIPLEVQEAGAELTPGQGGLQVLRLDAILVGALGDPTAILEYIDVNFTSLQGWKEIAAYGVRGQQVVDASVPDESISDELRAYPKRLMQNPPDVRFARVEVAPGPNADLDPDPVAGETTADPTVFGDGFASLIERDISLLSVLAAIVLAFFFGALHALGPGHGKTVMAAYLVGSEGKVRHAVTIGVAVSLMHTASVIALGLVTLWLVNLFPPAAVYPWLAFVSGLIVIGLGTWLFTVRWRARRIAEKPGHGHQHVNDHAHAHAAGVEHTHAPVPTTSPFSRKGLVAIALSGGLLPSPTALVVLLGAVALGRIVFGIALVTAFSIGLAAALTAVGIAVLRARDFARRRWGIGATSLLPLASSVAIVLVGIFLTVRAAIGLVA